VSSSESDPGSGDVTDLVIRWRHGDKAALDALMPLVYRELRAVAAGRLRGERGESLQTTVLVHEAYLRLVRLDRLTLENRAHFFAIAARVMRQIVVDHARRARADKRGGGRTTIDVHAEPAMEAPRVVDVLMLNEALEELSAMDQRLCRVVELKFFGGLTIDEMSRALDVSAATVERDWTAARAWLYQRMTSPGP
jgi:RNA polymerase sigma factor (TIGR02999 family)